MRKKFCQNYLYCADLDTMENADVTHFGLIKFMPVSYYRFYIWGGGGGIFLLE